MAKIKKFTAETACSFSIEQFSSFGYLARQCSSFLLKKNKNRELIQLNPTAKNNSI